ncbi:hypothetical protein QBC35DRAFT_463229 [Podospora australis]|uniref:Uncharacterized protein n=1 Tax=Podospora australis TaxID=1536484 RepID=A0AAN7AJS2_9PEZI|nr:hypothetical protein QBC35DRAFT_463229 [Podospora australis]
MFSSAIITLLSVLVLATPASAIITKITAHTSHVNTTPMPPPTHPPLGASVTYGQGSTTGNSYRLPLRDLLVSSGTNNCNLAPYLVPDAGKNVTEMIEDILKQSQGVTVILASLLRNKTPEQDACRVDVNR